MAEPVKPKRRYDSPRRREQAAATRARDPRRRPAPLRAHGYAGDDDGRDRGRGGRRAEDRLPRVRDQERPAARALAPAAARRPRTTSRWPSRLVPRGPGGARPRAPARLNARNSRVVKLRDRRRRRGDPRRRADRPGHRRALEPDPDRVPRQPAGDRRAPRTTRSALEPGLDVERATDILWTLNHPDVWQLLVGERGWTPEQYERWFAETSCEQLLGR